MPAFTVRLSQDVADKLDDIASKSDRSRSYVAAQAISDFVAREASHVAEIEAGLAEAHRGDFASAADVAAVLEKYAGTAEAK
jgi:predicted transcriptional regulator